MDSFLPISDSGLLEISQGFLQGLEREASLAFFEIPYAKPPIGQLRWAEPEVPDPWETEIYNATVNQHRSCPMYSDLTGSTEDCLTLNIFMPKPSEVEDDLLLPVMFWLHGGSFRNGNKDQNGFDGQYMAETHKVIVVNAEYRAGAFGFMYEESVPSIQGNQGIKDQVRALEWVNQNIEFFLGDKNKVTIFGESAGAQSVATLMTLKTPIGGKNLKNSLFQRAIIQSAPFSLPYHGKSDGNLEAKRFLKHIDCKDEDYNSDRELQWECARNKTMEEAIRAQVLTHDVVEGETPELLSLAEEWSPLLDGNFLEFDLYHGFLFNSAPTDIDLIYGFTSGEAHPFIYGVFPIKMGKTLYETAIKAIFRQDHEAVLEEFPSPCRLTQRNCDARDYLSGWANDYLFYCSNRKAIEFNREINNKPQTSIKTYKYLFTQPISQTHPCEEYSCHGAETGFHFHTRSDLNEENPKRLKLADHMSLAWANFATTGDPNIDRFGNENSLEDSFGERWEVYDKHKNGVEKAYVQKFEGDFETDYDTTQYIDGNCEFWDELDVYTEH